MDVRYENRTHFATFKTIGEDTVRYAWGMTGFGEMGFAIQTQYEALSTQDIIYTDGYRIVDEVPVSEGSDKAAGILLDWMSGVTR